MAKTIMRFALAALVSLLAGYHAGADAQVPAAPSLLLVGVIIPEGREPLAILEDPTTHEQEIYPLGAQIGTVRLTRIMKDRVVLTSGGSDVEVRLAGSPSPPPRPARQPVLPSRYGRPGPSNPYRGSVPGR